MGSERRIITLMPQRAAHTGETEMNSVTRAVVSETKQNTFFVGVLIRNGVDCWKSSRRYSKEFHSKEIAMNYAKTFTEVLAD
jgi:hypothetical protein